MPIDRQALARLGAQTRIAELVGEIDSLLAAFPELGKEQARPGVEKAVAPRKASSPARARRRGAPARRKDAAAESEVAVESQAQEPAERPKRTMSAEARARISAAQKKRWKAQKAQKKAAKSS